MTGGSNQNPVAATEGSEPYPQTGHFQPKFSEPLEKKVLKTSIF